MTAGSKAKSSLAKTMFLSFLLGREFGGVFVWLRFFLSVCTEFTLFVASAPLGFCFVL